MSEYIEPAKLSTQCIVCGKEIKLENGQSDIVPRMCNECKDAIMFAKEMQEETRRPFIYKVIPYLLGVCIGLIIWFALLKPYLNRMFP